MSGNKAAYLKVPQQNKELEGFFFGVSLLFKSLSSSGYYSLVYNGIYNFTLFRSRKRKAIIV